MAVHTIRAEGQEVLGGEGLVNLQVTIAAGALIERGGKSIYMAVLTGKRIPIRHLLMGIQLERDGIVIERGGTPAAGVVTGSALAAQRAFMRIILGVTRSAILRCALEDAVDMAVGTGGRGMFAVEMEGEL